MAAWGALLNLDILCLQILCEYTEMPTSTSKPSSVLAKENTRAFPIFEGMAVGRRASAEKGSSR